MPRQHNSTFVDERNVHPQCAGCNSFNGGAPAQYAVYILHTYGQDVLEELKQLRWQTRKFSEWELQNLIQEYKEKEEAIVLP